MKQKEFTNDYAYIAIVKAIESVKALGYKSKDIYERAGINSKTMNNWEIGKRTPCVESVMKMYKYLESLPGKKAEAICEQFKQDANLGYLLVKPPTSIHARMPEIEENMYSNQTKV